MRERASTTLREQNAVRSAMLDQECERFSRKQQRLSMQRRARKTLASHENAKSRQEQWQSSYLTARMPNSIWLSRKRVNAISPIGLAEHRQLHSSPRPQGLTVNERNRLIATFVSLAAKSNRDRSAEPLYSSLTHPRLELHYGGQRSRDSKKGFRAQMAARNRETRVDVLEKTHSSSTTLPDL